MSVTSVPCSQAVLYIRFPGRQSDFMRRVSHNVSGPSNLLEVVHSHHVWLFPKPYVVCWSRQKAFQARARHTVTVQANSPFQETICIALEDPLLPRQQQKYRPLPTFHLCRSIKLHERILSCQLTSEGSSSSHGLC